ncbi:MAG: xanthine dehydrogenase family protein molybdopterin-binding subunit [Pseudomonadales bacterium]|nr:xanthine dehydrogenase family protein molybdopterin-binding subunit [Pseudomonadales bacterium]
MAYKLIGQDFTPPDIHAKVTGKATYAEDFRAEGMAFIKLLLSPMPHSRVTNIDASEALKLPGVYGILTADEVPSFPPPQEQILNNAPNFVGEPILAIAAVDETTASDALELVRVSYEPLPFTLDPLESLYPGGPDANQGGNLVTAGAGEGEGGNGQLKSHKWTARDFAAAGEGQLPMGEPFIQWEYGDIDKAFAEAALVLDESFVTASNSHHSMEPRSAFAYWENGKCILHGSTQSQSFVMPALAGLIGVPPDQLVYISEFCGGGFGSKGSAYAVMAIPAHMSKKIGRPCMLRITRAEEYYVGSARAGFQGRVKLGFDSAGKVTAADLYIVQQNGSKSGFFDYSAAGEATSLVYTPASMRFRAIPIGTNTPPCGPQRGPGQNQLAMALEPILDKAARQLGIDRLSIRKINAPNENSRVANRQKVSSAYMQEALDMGAQRFDWAGKAARSGERKGSKVIGIGIGQAYHSAGAAGFDGLVRITPDGKLHIHTGVGNLGTYSYASTSRVAAEVLGCSWENCIVERGDSRKHLPWNLGQFGSNTSFTMSRTNYVAAMDAKVKLQEIAAMDLGGTPEDYDVADEKVFLKADPAQNLSFAQAAQRAIDLGGKYSGAEMPDDIFFLTKASVQGVAGTGLVGVAKDNLGLGNHVATMTATYAMIELDTETGRFDILEFVSTADCGTVVHPKGLAGQLRGGAVMGIGMARSERVVYDPQNGLAANVGFYQAKPPSYLDIPSIMDVAGVDKADPDNPLGMKGVGEPPTGAAAAAILCAISDALGGHYFHRNPVTPDMIVNAVAGRAQSHKPLQVNTQ